LIDKQNIEHFSLSPACDVQFYLVNCCMKWRN